MATTMHMPTGYCFCVLGWMTANNYPRGIEPRAAMWLTNATMLDILDAVEYARKDKLTVYCYSHGVRYPMAAAKWDVENGVAGNLEVTMSPLQFGEIDPAMPTLAELRKGGEDKGTMPSGKRLWIYQGTLFAECRELETTVIRGF